MFQCLYANVAQRAERVNFMVMQIELFAQLIFGAFSDSCVCRQCNSDTIKKYESKLFLVTYNCQADLYAVFRGR